MLSHLLGFFAYAALAVVTAFSAPKILVSGASSLIGQVEAFMLGWMVLLTGGMAHAFFAKALSRRDRHAHGDELVQGVAMQQQDIDLLRREIGGIPGALVTAAESGNLRGGGRLIEEVISEVKVLKSLMNRLSNSNEPVNSEPGARESDARELGAREETPRTEGTTMLSTVARQGKAQSIEKSVFPVLVQGSTGRPIQGPPPVASGLSDEEILETVREALRKDQIDLVVQPIVSLPQRKTRFYECFSRLRTATGEQILPNQYIPIAERAKHITAIDNLLLFRCVQLIRRIHRKSQDIDFFCNISPHTLGDTDYFKDFLDFLDSNQDLAGHLVFEFTQSDFDRWSEAGIGLLRRLSQLGCRISIDQVRDLELDPDVLAERQVSFVKVEVNLLLEALPRHPYLLQSLRRRGIDVIVEKVEDEGRVFGVLDYGIDFGQGYLFGKPRLAKPAGQARRLGPC